MLVDGGVFFGVLFIGWRVGRFARNGRQCRKRLDETAKDWARVVWETTLGALSLGACGWQARQGLLARLFLDSRFFLEVCGLLSAAPKLPSVYESP